MQGKMWCNNKNKYLTNSLIMKVLVEGITLDYIVQMASSNDDCRCKGNCKDNCFVDCSLGF